MFPLALPVVILFLLCRLWSQPASSIAEDVPNLVYQFIDEVPARLADAGVILPLRRPTYGQVLAIGAR